MKVDATKGDHKTGSNRLKTARTSGLAQQSVRSGSKKKEVASTERSHIAGKGIGVEKVIPTTVEKNHLLKDHGGQPNPTAINVEDEWPQNEQYSPVPHKGENADKQRCAFVDLGKDVQKNVPPSDPIRRFSSDDEERFHAPSRCENHVRRLRFFFTVVLEPNIHTFSVLSETLPDFLKSKLC